MRVLSDRAGGVVLIRCLLSCFTVDHASSHSRRNTLPTPTRDTPNIFSFFEGWEEGNVGDAIVNSGLFCVGINVSSAPLTCSSAPATRSSPRYVSTGSPERADRAKQDNIAHADSLSSPRAPEAASAFAVQGGEHDAYAPLYHFFLFGTGGMLWSSPRQVRDRPALASLFWKLLL